jgi:peptide deformylase
MKKALLSWALCWMSVSFAQTFTESERNLILSAPETVALKVTQVNIPEELEILKAVSTDIDPQEALLPVLAKRMYLAMRDPSRPGVGIAGPQVGINRNVFWVQRLDKPGQPFEFYINPKIVWGSGLLRKGMEGCLSIPIERGDVLRHYAIQVSYYDLEGKYHEEHLEGFTAVIFQHEYDHLIGTLFTERIQEQQQLQLKDLGGRVFEVVGGN